VGNLIAKQLKTVGNILVALKKTYGCLRFHAGKPLQCSPSNHFVCTKDTCNPIGFLC